MTNAFTREPGTNKLSEPTKFLPIAFIVFNIATLWGIYMTHHCIPMLQQPYTQQKGIFHTTFFNMMAFMLIYCYLRCISTVPGSIPDDKEFEYVPIGERSDSVHVHESKRSGDRRHCKWCAKYKPDRTHHCRVCRTCILRMDHHCPWIYNCVGFGNHKYFFLLLWYSAITCHIIVWTMRHTLKDAVNLPETPFFKMFCLLFGETLAVVLGALTTLFFLFHIWLMQKSMTTIEFCEKSMKRSAYDANIYDRGFYGNITAVLGDNPWLWLLPVSLPSGDGLFFVTDESPLLLSKDLEVGYNKPSKYETSSRPHAKKRADAGTGECAGSESSSQESERDAGRGQSPRDVSERAATTGSVGFSSRHSSPLMLP